MATTDVIDHGQIDMTVLREMYDSFPDDLMYEEQDPSSVIAALLWLDTKYDTHQEDDRVVLHPGLLYFLLLTATITDNDALAKLAAEARREIETEETSDVDFDAASLLAAQWFNVTFPELVDEDGKPLSSHPIMKDRSIAIRVLTEEEVDKLEAADALFWAATVRTDGSPIPVPPPSAGIVLP